MTSAAETSFSPPAELVGTTTLSGGQWAAIFFYGAESSFNLALPAARPSWNHTYLAIEGSIDGVGGQSQPIAKPDDEGVLPTTADFMFDGGSMIIHAESISVKTTDSLRTRIEAQSSGTPIAAHVPPIVFESNPYWDWDLDWSGPNVVAVMPAQSSSEISLEARGLSELHWFDSTVACDVEECPDGGGSHSVQRVGLGEGYHAREYAYGSAKLAGGSLGGTTRQAFVLIGGPSLDIVTLGAVRLPRAASSTDCQDCVPFAEKTVAATGEVILQNTSLTYDGRLKTNLGGTFTSSSLDETPVEPADLLGINLAASTATAAGLLVLVKFLIAPFFTRLSKDQALEHPRRKQIFEYIQQNPGANFREIARQTGIAAGTVRHHLNVLSRSDIIVEHQHGSTVRLFENLSKYQANWADTVLLREPSLGELYSWLKANPGAPQKAVLEGMEPAGWSRSTTQHRLSRLVDGGLATIRLQGRLKIYTAVERSAPRAPPGLGLGVGTPA